MKRNDLIKNIEENINIEGKNQTPTLSTKNSKLGGTTIQFNFLPEHSCDKNAPCYNSGCYAKKGNYNYKKVLMGSFKNMLLYQKDKKEFTSQIIKALNGDIMYKYFRWFSSGDIVDYDFIGVMVEIAKKTPQTHFLCYTKKYTLINVYLSKNKLPKNLTIIFSGWGDNWTFENPYNLPTTDVIFKGDKKEKIGFTCKGECEKCRKCWFAKNGEKILFNKH